MPALPLFHAARRADSIVGRIVFNENSLISTIDQEQRIDELKAQIEDATDTLTYYRELNRSLNNDRETMERIVREQHHMQHPDEDVYIFE